SRLNPAWQLHDFSEYMRAEGAITVFEILDQGAEGAIPTLANLMNDARATNCARRARSVILTLSYQVLAADLVLTTNGDATVRLESIRKLERFKASPRQAVPRLIQCLHD